MSKGLIWQNHPEEVIDVVYDTIYGYTIDEAMEILNQHRQGKFIQIEWMKSWAMKNWVKTKKCEYDIIVSKLIDDWLEERK